MDDFLLIQKAKFDSKSLGILYQKYVNDVFRYLYSKTLNKQDAEDLTTEVWIKVLKNFQNFDPKRANSFKSWLFTISYRTFIDFVRQNRHEKLELDEEITPDKTVNTEEIAIKSSLNKQILLEINNLPIRQRECLMLKLFSELSNKEIAEILEIDQRTVASNVIKGINHVKEAMNQSSKNI